MGFTPNVSLYFNHLPLEYKIPIHHIYITVLVLMSNQQSVQRLGLFHHGKRA